MRVRRSKYWWVVLFLVAAILVGTHWSAYQFGAASQNKRLGGAIENLSYDCEATALEEHVQYLQLLSKYPNDISVVERQERCLKTEELATMVEHGKAAQYRKLGNDPQADRWQRQVDEARRLIAKLNPEKK
jgi:hypothetical protein